MRGLLKSGAARRRLRSNPQPHRAGPGTHRVEGRALPEQPGADPAQIGVSRPLSVGLARQYRPPAPQPVEQRPPRMGAIGPAQQHPGLASAPAARVRVGREPDYHGRASVLRHEHVTGPKRGPGQGQGHGE